MGFKEWVLAGAIGFGPIILFQDTVYSQEPEISIASPKKESLENRIADAIKMMEKDPKSGQLLLGDLYLSEARRIKDEYAVLAKPNKAIFEEKGKITLLGTIHVTGQRRPIWSPGWVTDMDFAVPGGEVYSVALGYSDPVKDEFWFINGQRLGQYDGKIIKITGYAVIKGALRKKQFRIQSYSLEKELAERNQITKIEALTEEEAEKIRKMKELSSTQVDFARKAWECYLQAQSLGLADERFEKEKIMAAAIESRRSNAVAEYWDDSRFYAALKDRFPKSIVVGNEADLFEIRVNYFNNEGQLKREEIRLTEIIKSDPKNKYAYFDRGMVYCYMQDNEKAFADFKKAMELDPANQLFLDYVDALKPK